MDVPKRMKTLPHWSRFTIAKEKRMTTYEYLNLTASYGGLALICYGIRVMAKGAETRAADSERKHEQVMTASDRRHNEFMTDSDRRHNEFMTDSDRRHNEFMTDSERRHEESMASLRELIDGQAESRMALRKLIERTG